MLLNNILYNLYIENIDDFNFHLSTIVQATLQLGALQISARLVHYSMGVAHKTDFRGNEIAYEVLALEIDIFPNGFLCKFHQ